MKVRPILFNGEMVRAILDRRKTQTRRVVKPQPDDVWHESGWKNGGVGMRFGMEVEGVLCPYGVPGDRLWVRETWAAVMFYEAHVEGFGLGYADDWEGSSHIPQGPSEYTILYRADNEWDESVEDRGFRWRPSIHMPHWASRITLEVTDVRVERVQDISEADAEAEGAPPILVPPDGGGAPFTEGFMDLWDSINAKRGFGWDANPWVWVVAFRSVDAVPR